MKKIRYISWNYGKTKEGEWMHLIKFEDESAILLTGSEMVQRGLAEWKK